MNIEQTVHYSAGSLTQAIEQGIQEWEKEQKTARLWESDPSLWTSQDENKWTGWLDIAESELTEIQKIENLAQNLKEMGITDIALLGMGGSSLCPDMMAKTFAKLDPIPRLHILDSTDPLQVMHLEKKLDIKNTFFIVSSKSGSTLEPNIFKEYFYEKSDGDHFAAITDPGSKLENIAKEDHFKALFFGKPSIGGRYSALSNFGMVPSGLMGMNLKDFLHYATLMSRACSPQIPIEKNPGVVLGMVLGICAKHGKDKVTLITSPGIQTLGAWLEQLLAESTGKHGKGLIPVDLEPVGKPEVYGNDRVFVYVRLENDPDHEQDKAVEILEKSGHVVVRSILNEKMHLGGELFKWEMATAVAGSVLELNPFDQPDVEASKVRALAITKEYSQTGKISQPSPFFTEGNIELYTDDQNQKDIETFLQGKPSLKAFLQAHLNRIKAGDYFDIAAFIEMDEKNLELLQESRLLVRDSKKVATCLGFGPRFLHSTGQLYKGGPNTGVFLQITTDHEQNLKIPGEKFTFDLVITAQAQADFEVLTQRSRRALRFHIKGDIQAGLKELKKLIGSVL